MKKIVYHGTFSEKAPHEYEQETFHAGTLRSTEDRLEDEASHGIDFSEVATPIWTVHKYEISDEAPMSRRMWSDPMFPNTNAIEVPEYKTNRIYPYKNAREDRGSTSYVIPSNFVGGPVKHLGVQFKSMVNPYLSEKEVSSLSNASSTMAGGRYEASE